GVAEAWLKVMLVAVTLAAVQVGAPVQLVMQLPLLPAVWNVRTELPVLVVPMANVPVPPALLPGSSTVTSTVYERPVSLMMKPGVGARAREGTMLPPARRSAPALSNGL